MSYKKPPSPVTIERLERGLWAAAILVKNLGDEYGFLIDRLEKEIELLKRDNFSSRAEDILARYTTKGPR